MNKFKTVTEAGLASQVLTEVLNNAISFHYYAGQPVSVSPHDGYWQVQSGFDYVTALFIWNQNQESGSYGGGSCPSWADDALSAWKEWEKNATPSEYSAVEQKVAKIFNDFREDVTNAKSAGYSWNDDIGGWTNESGWPNESDMY